MHIPDLLDYPTAVYFIAPLIVLTGYVVYGLGGFGATVITAPVLAHFLPLTFVVPTMVLLDLVASLFVGNRAARHVNRTEVRRLLPWLLAGILLGGTLLVNLPGRPALAALGAFCIAFGAFTLVGPAVRGVIHTRWAVPAGLAGGMFAALFGSGGPIYVVYIAHRLTDKAQVRATVSAMITVSTITRIALYAATGLLLDAKLLTAAALLVPVVWVGIRIGSHLHISLSEAHMRRLIGALLLVNGASLLVRNLAWNPA